MSRWKLPCIYCGALTVLRRFGFAVCRAHGDLPDSDPHFTVTG